MGGQDKGLLPLQGEPLALRAAMALEPQVDRLSLNASLERREEYRRLGWPVCTDTIPDQPGPLAGMVAGFDPGHPWLATAPCDTPAPPVDLVQRLFNACARRGATLAVACDGDGRMHPVFALIHSHWRPELEAALANGVRRAGQWMRDMGAVEVSFPDSAAFANINTPEEWERLESTLLPPSRGRP